MIRHAEFFSYLKEREVIRLNKEAGDLFPWTEDEILQKYKFTNVRRENDTVSKELITRFYTPHFNDDPKTILMNCALFRYFGTWEFAAAVGWQEYDTFDFEFIKDTAADRLAHKERTFTGAYVITNQGISAPKQEVVVDIFLKGLHEVAEDIVAVSNVFQEWQETAKVMRKIKGFGGSGFMTKEILIDTTYTGFWDDKEGTGSLPSDWYDWTPIGPGALRGAARLLGDDSAKPVKEYSAFDVIMEAFGHQSTYWPSNYGLLSPTDIQFGMCEFDKYERVRLGQGRPRSRYRAP